MSWELDAGIQQLAASHPAAPTTQLQAAVRTPVHMAVCVRDVRACQGGIGDIKTTIANSIAAAKNFFDDVRMRARARTHLSTLYMLACHGMRACVHLLAYYVHRRSSRRASARSRRLSRPA